MLKLVRTTCLCGAEVRLLPVAPNEGSPLVYDMQGRSHKCEGASLLRMKRDGKRIFLWHPSGKWTPYTPHQTLPVRS